MSRASLEPVTIAVLAKAPIPGLAKTRLAPTLGAKGAAALQERLTARAVATAAAAGVGPVCLWATPDASHRSFRDCAEQHRLTLAQQPDVDLGLRMLAALAAARGPALVIGTDCPALTSAHLQSAAAHLRAGIDAVLIAADDGGYVLIGMREPQTALFTGMRWGSDAVAAETRRRMAQAGLSWREPARLWDVDRAEDVARLRNEGLGDLLRPPSPRQSDPGHFSQGSVSQAP
jgi:rSAM/selenodomain-associated transferase 1